MTSESIVRLADPRDEDGLMELLRELYSENAIFKIDEDCVRSYLHRAFRNESAMIGVIGAPGHIEGALYLVIGQFWYTREKHLEEFFNYVRPEHRRSKHAQSLLAWAKGLSNETLPLVIGVISNKRTEAKIKLYERQFGKQAGAFFVFNRERAHGPALPA